MPKRLSAVFYPTLSFVILIAAWHYLSGLTNSWILPSPLKVLSAFTQAHGLILHHLTFTLKATLYGFSLSVLLGIVTAILMDSSSFFKQTVYPYMIVSQTIPIIAVAPILIIWFGYGISSKIFTVVLICFFPIALNFWTGLSGTNIEQIRLLKSMGAGKAKIFYYLKLPASLPYLFTGLKLSATYSVMGAIIGEWLGGHGGLGIYMTRASKSYLTHHVYAVVLVIVLLSLALFLLVVILERLLLPWNIKKSDEYRDLTQKT